MSDLLTYIPHSEPLSFSRRPKDGTNVEMLGVEGILMRMSSVI